MGERCLHAVAGRRPGNAWVTFGAGPPRVLFMAVLFLGMRLCWLVPAALRVVLSGPPRSSQRASRRLTRYVRVGRTAAT